MPTDQSPLSKAVHELVNAQQSAAEGNSSVAGEQSARQNTVVSESAGVKADLGNKSALGNVINVPLTGVADQYGGD